MPALLCNPAPSQDEWPALVVVPASLRLVWAEEVEKWLPHLRPSCVHVIEGKEDRVAAGALPLVTITRWAGAPVNESGAAELLGGLSRHQLHSACGCRSSGCCSARRSCLGRPPEALSSRHS